MNVKMPSKKKKYNARFPAGRIKKIMQTDEEVGKVAQAVPVIISRTLELFVESLLTKATHITLSRNAKTLTPSHMKQCILSESRFDFLKDLVKNIPDASVQEDNENNALAAAEFAVPKVEPAAEEHDAPSEIAANFYTEQSTSSNRLPVIQYSPKLTRAEPSLPQPAEVPKLNFSVSALVGGVKEETVVRGGSPPPVVKTLPKAADEGLLVAPAPSSNYGQSTSDNLYIDEDYDN